MVLEIYLDNREREKLKIFMQLSENNLEYFSTRSLLKKTSFSYNKTRNFLLEINLDLIKLYQRSLFADNGQIHFQKSRFNLGQYQTFLLSHSVTYQFLLDLLIYPYDTLTDYCEQNNVSRSTIHRKLEPLRHYLKTLGIHLNINKMILTGSEIAIRAFYLQTLWLGDSQDYLKYNTEVIEISAQLDRWIEPWGNQINYQRGRLALVIAYFRIKAAQLVADNDRYTDYLFPNFQPIIQQFFAQICPNDLSANAELYYFYYDQFYQPIYLSIVDQRLPLVRQNLKQLEFIKHLPLSLINCVKGMLRKDLLTSELELFQLNFYNLFANVQLWESIPASLVLRNTLAISHRNHSLLTAIQRHLVPVLKQVAKQKKTAWLAKNIESVALSCAQLVLPYVNPEISTNLVNVGLHNDPDSFLIQDVLRFCSNIPFINIELFNADRSATYDFIITNHPQPENKQLPIFTLNNGYFSYSGLLTALEHQYSLQKNHH